MALHDRWSRCGHRAHRVRDRLRVLGVRSGSRAHGRSPGSAAARRGDSVSSTRSAGDDGSAGTSACRRRDVGRRTQAEEGEKEEVIACISSVAVARRAELDENHQRWDCAIEALPGTLPGMADGIILLVEDNPNDEELTLRAFRKNKIANPIVVVRDGAEALDYVFARGDHAGVDALPDVMLLDLKLPKVDGLEVLRQVRADERTRLMPVIVLTSSVEEQDVIRGYRLGANSYVRKPVDFSQFVEAVKQLGLYWLVLNQAPPRP
jgi:two-component system response regulator